MENGENLKTVTSASQSKEISGFFKKPEPNNQEKASKMVKEVRNNGPTNNEAKVGTEPANLQTILENEKLNQIEELNDQDAAREYLDILMYLSSGFTSPEGIASRVVGKDQNGNPFNRGGYSGDRDIAISLLTIAVGRQGYNKIKEDDLKAEKNGEIGSGYDDKPISKNKYVDRAHSLGLADNIIAVEQRWREGGEMFDQGKYDIARSELKNFQTEDKKKFFLTKIFTRGRRVTELARLESNVMKAEHGERVTYLANESLRRALSVAYDGDYSYGKHYEGYDVTEGEINRKNINYNETFFSQKNRAKIDRAIALRIKLKPYQDKDRKFMEK